MSAKDRKTGFQQFEKAEGDFLLEAILFRRTDGL